MVVVESIDLSIGHVKKFRCAEDAEATFPSLQFKVELPSDVKENLTIGTGTRLFFKGVEVKGIEKFSYTISHSDDVNKTELHITLLGVQVEQCFKDE